MPGTGAALTRAQWAGFLALCLLGASAWLIDNAWPSPLPANSRLILDNLILAILAGTFGWRTLRRTSAQHVSRARLALASILLLGIPAALAQTALNRISEVTVAALFAFVPIAVVVLVANLDPSLSPPAATNLLAPALAGLAGILLLLPVETPSTLRDAAFAGLAILAALVAASAAVWMHRLLRGVPLTEAAAVSCLANAIFFLAFALISHAVQGQDAAPPWPPQGLTRSALAGEALRAIGFDLPQLLLLFWLLRELPPIRFAARYLLIPVLTVLEGYAMMRPELSYRAVCGAALALAGAWRLLTADAPPGEPGLMLR